MPFWRIILCVLALLASSFAPPPARTEMVSAAPAFDVVARYPHDPKAFTQGLFIRDGVLFESTGLEGKSDIRRVRLSDGKVIKSSKLPANLFGEGMVDWGQELISITWRNGVGYRWNIKSLKAKTKFTYRGEGWGLTRDDKQLYMSDGTPYIRVLDPANFKEKGTIRVTSAGSPVANLNELEWIKGRIYANIWTSNQIAVIDPPNGNVVAWIDLTPLVVEATGRVDNLDRVANGIAYDAAKDVIYVTGKNWPVLFAIKLKSSIF